MLLLFLQAPLSRLLQVIGYQLLPPHPLVMTAYLLDYLFLLLVPPALLEPLQIQILLAGHPQTQRLVWPMGSLTLPLPMQITPSLLPPPILLIHPGTGMPPSFIILMAHPGINLGFLLVMAHPPHPLLPCNPSLLMGRNLLPTFHGMY